MKVLYAIQGTGNGHLSRARDVIPALQKKCTVDILVSGIQADVRLRYPVKYRLRGLSFIFGKNGGVDLWRTYNESSLRSLQNEIKNLRVEDYDFVVNDFEPVSAWACRLKNVPCISLSHQSSLLSNKVPKPKKKDIIGSIILKHYAPANYHFGFHFSNYDKNIYTPVIRKEVRELEVDDYGHYTVYLPSYNDSKLFSILSQFKNTRWQVFSKHNIRYYRKDNVVIYPISNERFTQSMANCKGVLCGAGFETPAEAIYLGKKLLVIPMKGQLEQHYNAAALNNIGIPVIKNLKKKNHDKLQNWLNSDEIINIDFPDITDNVVNKLFEYYIRNYQNRIEIDSSKKIDLKVSAISS
jgi:uncharacterized protein (TIGR00661 family)